MAVRSELRLWQQIGKFSVGHHPVVCILHVLHGDRMRIMFLVTLKQIFHIVSLTWSGSGHHNIVKRHSRSGICEFFTTFCHCSHALPCRYSLFNGVYHTQACLITYRIDLFSRTEVEYGKIKHRHLNFYTLFGRD